MDKSEDEVKERAFLIREMAHHAASFTHAMEMLGNRIDRFAEAKGGMIPRSETDAGLYQIAAWERLFRCFDAPCAALAQSGDTAPAEYLASLLERVLHASIVATPTPYVSQALQATGVAPIGKLIGKINAKGKPATTPGPDPMLAIFNMRKEEQKAMHEDVLKLQKMQAESMRRIIDSRIATSKKIQDLWNRR